MEIFVVYSWPGHPHVAVRVEIFLDGKAHAEEHARSPHMRHLTYKMTKETSYASIGTAGMPRER